MSGLNAAAQDTSLDALLCGRSKLLVLAPHPDDEVFGCAGLIQAALAAGKQVHVAVASDGEACYQRLPQERQRALARVRRHESRSAAHCLGLPPDALSFLALHDGKLGRQLTDLTSCVSALSGTHTCLAATWAGDGHPDHLAVATAARRVQQQTDCALISYAVWSRLAHSPERSALQAANPLRLSSTDRARRNKHLAAHCFISQLSGFEDRAPLIRRETLAAFIEEPEMYLSSTQPSSRLAFSPAAGANGARSSAQACE